MTRPAHVAVVVPARNEEARIDACLTAIDVAVGVAVDSAVDVGTRGADTRAGVTASVTVVLDRCTDATAAVVAGHPLVDVVVSHAGNVGAARAAGTQAALARSPVPVEQVWTAHTDADSLVPPTWLCTQLDLAGLGADLVLGTVRPSLAEPAMSAWLGLHDAGDGHPHVHGANLGVSARLLADLGGWPLLADGEDDELVRRAVARGAGIVRTGAEPVRTSARLSGRTPGGMAGYLRELTGSP